MRIEGAYDEDDWYGEVRCDGEVLSPKRSLRLRNHSPTGFAWGYAGSGPAQLALAILLQAGVEERRALLLYQRFKGAFIQGLPQQAFLLDIDVQAWASTIADPEWARSDR